MAKQNEILMTEQAGARTEEHIGTESTDGKRKLFVEPEISVPVDVLEATTFFQTVTSSGTN